MKNEKEPDVNERRVNERQKEKSLKDGTKEGMNE